jgi:branched-chain amino acid transport system permease protein
MIFPDPAYFLGQIVYGLVVGSTYSLMGIGLSLIFGVLGVFNFAHGEFFMIGTYTSYFLWALLGLDPLSSLFLAMVVALSFGYFLERVTLRPLRRRTRHWEDPALVLTLGLSILIQNSAVVVLGREMYARPWYFQGNLVIGSFSIALERFLIFVFTTVLITGFWIFIEYTKTGKTIRAVAQNRDAASLVGVNVDRVFALTFGVAAGLAAAAGSLLVPLFQAFPAVGSPVLLKSFVVVALGGLGNVKGAIFSGFIVGVAEALFVVFVSSAWKDALTFVLLVIILMVRPSGLFGQAQRGW